VNVFLFSAAKEEKAWQPPLDIYRASWGWILKLDLAGVRMEDVHVHVTRRTVIVSGVRRDHMVEDGCSHYSMEITYNRFQRTIELPDDFNLSNVRMEYRDGILFVRIRTKEETKSE
jgi:HSP20 family protein